MTEQAQYTCINCRAMVHPIDKVTWVTMRIADSFDDDVVGELVRTTPYRFEPVTVAAHLLCMTLEQLFEARNHMCRVANVSGFRPTLALVERRIDDLFDRCVETNRRTAIEIEDFRPFEVEIKRSAENAPSLPKPRVKGDGEYARDIDLGDDEPSNDASKFDKEKDDDGDWRVVPEEEDEDRWFRESLLTSRKTK